MPNSNLLGRPGPNPESRASRGHFCPVCRTGPSYERMPGDPPLPVQVYLGDNSPIPDENQPADPEDRCGTVDAIPGHPPAPEPCGHCGKDWPLEISVTLGDRTPHDPTDQDPDEELSEFLRDMSEDAPS